MEFAEIIPIFDRYAPIHRISSIQASAWLLPPVSTIRGACHYEPGIGRFLSPDSTAPDLLNPQSLNKYSYCFNNPLKYNDPTGNWPNWGNIGKAIKTAVTASVNFVKEHIDVVHTVLDIAGMIPVVGEAFDAINGIIYAAQGDKVNAAMSFASCIPVAGKIIGGSKLVCKTIGKVATATQKLLKGADEVEEVFTSFPCWKRA